MSNLPSCLPNPLEKKIPYGSIMGPLLPHTKTPIQHVKTLVTGDVRTFTSSIRKKEEPKSSKMSILVLVGGEYPPKERTLSMQVEMTDVNSIQRVMINEKPSIQAPKEPDTPAML